MRLRALLGVILLAASKYEDDKCSFRPLGMEKYVLKVKRAFKGEKVKG